MTTPPEPDTGLDQRVTSLEHGQVSIEGKLDKLLGMFTDRTPDAKPEPERPEVNIAEEIRRGLAELASTKPAETPSAPSKAELAEKPPVAPVRKVTRAIWGDPD